MNIVKPKAIAYFITFTCYGTWLHGNKEHSVDRTHNKIFTPFLNKNDKRASSETTKMREKPYFLNAEKRKVVLDAILETCAYRHWNVYALHVRSNHVHLVIQNTNAPEKILRIIKAYASRKLRAIFPEETRLKFWTEHGSTRHLFNEVEICYTVRYVAEEQGEPMALFYDKNAAKIFA